MLLKIYLIFFCIYLSITVQGRKRRPNKNSLRKKDSHTTGDFDIFIFTQEWPPTACYDWKKNHPTHSCSFPHDDDEWIIHGVWPTKYNTSGPNDCNSTIPFIPNNLSPIMDELKEKWTNIHKDIDVYGFWRHEWQKHGSCSVNIETINTEYKFFKKALELFDKYDMKHSLAKANILPGRNYTAKAILDGIDQIFGAQSHVICKTSKAENKRYLSEIRLCLDKSFNLINCTSNGQTNCKQGKPILYPGTTPNQYQVIQI